MAKKLKNYFSHDSDARNDGKLIRLRKVFGAEGYGIYFMLLELIASEEDFTYPTDYEAIAWQLHIDDAEKVRAVVEDFDLFSFDESEEYFYSDSFNRRYEEKNAISKVRAEAGKKGGQAYKPTEAKVSKDQAKVSKLEKENSPCTPLKEKEKNKKEKFSSSTTTQACASACEDGGLKGKPPTKEDRERWYVDLANDQSFAEKVAMDFSIPVQNVALLLSAFYAEITTTKKIHPSETEFRRHALNWINRHMEIQNDKKQKTNGTSTTNRGGSTPEQRQEECADLIIELRNRPDPSQAVQG